MNVPNVYPQTTASVDRRAGPIRLERRVSLLILLAATACALSGTAQNIAPAGTGILGYQAAVDNSAGTLYFHVGSASAINDGDPDSHVDNWTGGSDQGQGVSFVGVLWPSLRYEQITSLTLTMAAFLDGGRDRHTLWTGWDPSQYQRWRPNHPRRHMERDTAHFR